MEHFLLANRKLLLKKPQWIGCAELVEIVHVAGCRSKKHLEELNALRAELEDEEAGLADIPLETTLEEHSQGNQPKAFQNLYF